MDVPNATKFGVAMEAHLQQESMLWNATCDISNVPWASTDDIPVLDLTPFLHGDVDSTRELAAKLRLVGESIGFHYVTGHGIDPSVIDAAMDADKSFHALPVEEKMAYAMDQPKHEEIVFEGAGYLPVDNRKLPRRDTPNHNECFIVKRDTTREIGFDRMPWPREDLVCGFRGAVERYAAAMERLAMQMLPLYAMALRLPADYFAAAFKSPLLRIRLSHYPASEGAQYGINPHVDTSFFTILATSSPGLVVFSSKSNRWVRCCDVPGALIINTGQLLRQITNDRWLATKHYAVNADGDARYSLPFFFNATADYPLAVVPTCCSDEVPAKYSPTSYLAGQGVAQGE